MGGLGCEESTQLVDGRAQNSGGHAETHPAQQPKREEPAENHVEGNKPLHPVKKISSAAQIAQQNREPCGRVEHLRLQVGIQWHAGIRVWVPERRPSIAHTTRYIRDQGKMIPLHVVGYVGAGINQNVPEEYDRLEDDPAHAAKCSGQRVPVVSGAVGHVPGLRRMPMSGLSILVQCIIAR